MSYILYFICYMLYIICYMLYVICYMLYVICYVLCLKFNMLYWIFHSIIYINGFRFCRVCTILNSILTALVYIFKRGFTCVSKSQWSFLCRWLLSWAAFCSSLYVSYNYSTKVWVRRYNVFFYKPLCRNFPSTLVHLGYNIEYISFAS